MSILIAGLIVFLGLHCLPMNGELRDKLVGQLGAGLYRVVFSLLSAVGLILIIYGFGLAQVHGSALLYEPPVWTRHVAMLLMVPVFVLLIAAYVQGRIKKAVRHPMLVAVKLWALSHLLVNGDLASVLLFGSFLVWAIVDRISIKRRTKSEPSMALQLDEGAKFAEVLVILAGLLVYGLFVWKGHQLVIGVPLT